MEETAKEEGREIVCEKDSAHPFEVWARQRMPVPSRNWKRHRKGVILGES